jgi:hypothetical protein
MTRRAVAVGFAILLGTALCFAAPQPQASAQPGVDDVLAHYVRALGGEAAFHKLSTRVMKGSIQAPASGDTGSIVPGTIEVDQKAPNKRVVLINFPGGGGDANGYNGTTGWYLDPDEGPKDMEPAQVEALKPQVDFYREIRLKELFPKIAFQGTAKVNGHDAYVLEAPHPNGGVEKFYFDRTTGLLLRDETPVDVPDEGRTTIVSDFDDYREVDGVKLPFSVHQTSPDFEYIIKFTEIKQNVPIDDTKFNRPAGEGG